MTLPSTGPLSFADINAELGLPVGTIISLNDPAVRDIAGIPSGPISFGDLRGKSAEFFYDYTAGGTNLNLRTIADAVGFEGGTGKTVRIRVSGSNIVASSISVPALEVGSWPTGTKLTLEVACNLFGYAGNGGSSGSNGGGGAGQAGGPALKAGTVISGGTLTVVAAGGILYAGGGGGGGGGGERYTTSGTTLDGGGKTAYRQGGAGGRGAGAQGGNVGGASPRGGTGGSYGANGGNGGSSTYGGGGGGAAGAAFLNSSLMSRIGWTPGINYYGTVA